MAPAHCPFCHPDPERLVARSPLTLTVRDAFPVSPGHTLIVPRRHFADLFEATPDEIAEIWQALSQAAAALSAGKGGGPGAPDGYNVGVNVGAAAGQTVMHLHVHLIPRYAGDQSDPRGGIRRIFPKLMAYWDLGWGPKEA
jgi:diadenosine tetraphosphate (Ap4A) HIT family hydrolase